MVTPLGYYYYLMAIKQVKIKDVPKKSSLESSNNWYKAKFQVSSIENSLILKRLSFEKWFCIKKIEFQNVILHQT